MSLFLGCGSNVSSVFKGFAVLFKFVPCVSTQWPVWDLGVHLPYSSTVKAFGVLFRSMHAQHETEQRSLYKEFYGMMVLISFLSVIWHIRLPEAPVLNPFILPCNFRDYLCIWDQVVGNQREKTVMERLPMFLVPQLLWLEWRSLFQQSFRFLFACCCCRCCQKMLWGVTM